MRSHRHPVRRAALALAALLISPVARAADEPLPQGHYEERRGPAPATTLCVDIAPGEMVLTFRPSGPGGWLAVRVSGPYRGRKTGADRFTARLTVSRIVEKGISRCRKRVVNRTLDRTEQLGIPIRPGDVLTASLRFRNADRRLDVCLKRADGKGARPCRHLERR